MRKVTIITALLLQCNLYMGAQNLIPSGSPLYKLPYKNTYIMQTLVAENYRTAKMVRTKPGTFEQARRILPNPHWEGHAKEIEMYWKAWQIGISNISQPLDDSGFITSYIGPAYNGNIFMWDDAFITMFCRYGRNFFPFQSTLDNFYAKQHPDGFICREIRADGSDCFSRYDPTSTGPNILPWSEWMYYQQTGDDNRLNKVFPALAADNPKYHTNGRYWEGGVWPGTNYMVVSGLWDKGYLDLARSIARNHYDNVLKVYEKTGTFWEYYAPESAEPGFMARKDFVGWTGLPPISYLLEYIFGIHTNAVERQMTLDVTLTDGYGISRYPFGEKGSVDINVARRSSTTDKPRITIQSTAPFTLTVLCGNGQKASYNVKAGTNKF